ISAASTMARVDGPPEPMMMPVRSLETSLASSPPSRIACSMATWFQAAPPPSKRKARRSTMPSGSSVGAPCTWLRKPRSAYLSARLIPERAECRLASTSWVLLPIDETTPMPVTTTRVMNTSQNRSRSGAAGPGADQADAHVGDLIHPLAVRLQPTVGDREIELALEDALDVDAVENLLGARQHLVGELHLADAERPAAARQAQPAEEKARHLPQRIQAEATRHHRIAFEMAIEKPLVGLDVELRAREPLAVRAAGLRDLRDPVEHQHRRQRQLGVAGAEHFPAPAGEQFLVFES